MLYCPCGSEKKYSECCQAIISKNIQAKTAEQLMRSRYCAYVTRQAQYIFETYAQKSKQHQSIEEIALWAKQCRWVKLVIVQTFTDDNFSYVEFIAEYLQQNTLHQLHELSRFIQEDNQWRYVDGEIKNHSVIKSIKRNDLCPCQSNKKFKRCCGSSP